MSPSKPERDGFSRIPPFVSLSAIPLSDAFPMLPLQSVEFVLCAPDTLERVLGPLLRLMCSIGPALAKHRDFLR